MHRVEPQSREILRTHRPLLQRIVTITSRRRRLTADEENALSRFVVAEMSGPDSHGLGRFRGHSSLSSYLAVVVQRLYHALVGLRASSDPEPTALEDAIRRTSSELSSRDALLLKMWFESGMTAQKIAKVLGMHPRDVHATIAKRTGGVQRKLAESRPPLPSVDD
jgi:hypothetical protein